jgi:ACT domain-containing protein
LYEPDHEAIAGAVEDGDIQDIVDVVDKPQSEKTIGLYLSIMIDLSSRALSMAQNMPIPQDAKDKLQSAATQIREVLYSITPEEQL